MTRVGSQRHKKKKEITNQCGVTSEMTEICVAAEKH